MQQNFEQKFADIIDAKTPKEQAKKFLLALNEKPFSAAIFSAAMKVLKARMTKINAPADAIDVCGTGGDKLNTLNISTAVCFVVAACGVKVAKHGNRAISSQSGSADIFAELGVKIQDDKVQIEANLNKHNLCFLFAPFFHQSLKNLAEIRKEIAEEFKTPTIFNYLGPLLNPANTTRQMIGVSRADIMQPMAEALLQSGAQKIFIVHGFDGMDEITLCDKSRLLKIADGKIHQEEIIDPKNYGFAEVAIEEIKGGDAKYNAEKLLELLAGKDSAYQEIVVLNSAFALVLAGKSATIEEGVGRARQAIKSGAALEVLQGLRR